MYSFLVDDSSEYEKVNGVKKNVAAVISHGEHTDVLLNKKCLRNSMNINQVKIIKEKLMKSARFLFPSFHDTNAYPTQWM